MTTFPAATKIVGQSGHTTDHNLITEYMAAGLFFNITAPEFGAVGDGVTDSTTAIEAAWAAADAASGAGGLVFVPPGSFVYNGNGWTSANPRMLGAGQSVSKIILAAGKALYSGSQQISELLLRNLYISGGFGAIRYSNTSTNVTTNHYVDGNYFFHYTGACISHNATDWPFWKIRNNIFSGQSHVGTMGIALSGLSDSTVIEGNGFRAGQVHIKLRDGGGKVSVRDNDIIRYDVDGTNRVGVWLVPKTTNVNAGNGNDISANKFGAENLQPGDYHILIADEDTSTGSDNGTYFPKLSADSTGYVIASNFTNNMVAGTDNAPAVPYVYSTTPNVEACQFSIMSVGTKPAYLLQFRTVPSKNERNNRDNIFGPITAKEHATTTDTAIALSNGYAPGVLWDPTNQFSTLADTYQSAPPAGDPAGYIDLLTSGVRSFSVGGGGSTSNVTDALGGTDALEYSMAAGVGGIFKTIDVTPTAGVPMWVEFDLKDGSTPITKCKVNIVDSGGSPIHWQRVIEPGSTWKRHRYPVTLRNVAGTPVIQFGGYSTSDGTPAVGRVRIYHSAEPVNVDMAGPNGGHMPWQVDVDVFPAAVTHTNFDTVTVDTGCVGNAYKTTTAGAQNDEINFSVPLGKGTWTFNLMHVKDADKGIYTVSIDGTSIGTIDGYAAAPAKNTRTQIASVAVNRSGKHALKLKMATKNASSSNYFGAIQRITLQRTA